MIDNEITRSYAPPSVLLTEREVELHVWYASNAIARGHADDCQLVTKARNWPRLFSRPACSCGRDRM